MKAERIHQYVMLSLHLCLIHEMLLNCLTSVECFPFLNEKVYVSSVT